VQIQDQPVVLVIGLVAVPACIKTAVGAEVKELLCAEPQAGVIEVVVLLAEQVLDLFQLILCKSRPARGFSYWIGCCSALINQLMAQK
jgi:hypothetical protein